MILELILTLKFIVQLTFTSKHKSLYLRSLLIESILYTQFIRNQILSTQPNILDSHLHTALTWHMS